MAQTEQFLTVRDGTYGVLSYFEANSVLRMVARKTGDSWTSSRARNKLVKNRQERQEAVRTRLWQA